MLELDGFWSKRLIQSRKGTDWLALLKAIVIYRLTAPGSELQMHERWLKDSAAEELFGSGVLTGKSTLYNCLDKALYPLEEWKKERNKRTVTFVEPKDDVSLLLNQLCFTLPEQPPPKISECPDKQ